MRKLSYYSVINFSSITCTLQGLVLTVWNQNIPKYGFRITFVINNEMIKSDLLFALSLLEFNNKTKDFRTVLYQSLNIAYNAD